MTNKRIEVYALKNRFEDVGGDDDGEMYTTDDICLWLATKKNENSISFCHLTGGYYTIENPTFQQIKNTILLFKSAQYNGMEEMKKQKKQFRLQLLAMLREFIQKQE